MKKIFLIYLLFGFCFSALGQITGTVTNSSGEALPYVNIYPEGSFTGTTSNENGHYELEISTPGEYIITFQFLGFKTEKKQISIASFPFELNVQLTEESTTLDEVVINSGENPAKRIMQNAINKRKDHKEKISAYTADFYSRGIWRIKNAPEKILGQEIGDLGGGLDSTRSGIIYLSETISKITFKAPDDFKEKIIASKVSGNDNGFSLNTAQDATLSFYNNTITLNSQIISPLADYAFNYYDFELEGIFYNERGNRINKIKIHPKRPKDNVFSGFIYIVEDSWQIYGLELKTTGEAMQVPPVEEVIITQNFNYAEEEELWVPISQTVDFEFGMFGISGNGRFTAVYTNYDFSPGINEKTFSNEILSFAPEANKKDSLFWKEVRPIPLTIEEKNDYLIKDSIQGYRNSDKYLDSIDQVQNKFALSNILLGYSYQNSIKNQYFSISSPLFNTNVNTVQGYNSSVTFSFQQNSDDTNNQFWRIYSKIGYGFSEEKLRISGGFQKKFNNFSKPILSIFGGNKIDQINNREPISERLNSITTNFFERNYLKLYEKTYLQASFQQEIWNGFYASTSIEYEDRAPLFNHWDHPWIDRDDVEFTSNNPLEPFNFNSAPFERHHIFKFSLAARIEFDQKYLSYPDGKFAISSNKYPSLRVAFEKGFGSNISAYNFAHLRSELSQSFKIGNKGEFGYNIIGGTFFNDEEVSFLDYRHFNGNQTHIGTSSNYLTSFNLLPYYEFSTKANYLEAHFEHNFKGWVLGKIPLINRLNYNLVLGAHQLYVDGINPYSEFSVGLDNLGIGKFRFLRLDYVVSEYMGRREGAFIFGLKFL